MGQLRGKLLFIVPLCLVLIAALLLAACPGAPAPAKVLKIGLLFPYTGVGLAPEHAPAEEAAARLALEDAGMQVAGKTIEYVTGDDGCDPEVALRNARKMVESDKVDVLLGGLFGNVAVAVAGYAKEAGVAYAPWQQQAFEVIKTAPDNTVLPTGTLEGSTYPGGLYAYDELGCRTATVIYQDYIAGYVVAGGWMEGFTSRGGNVIQQQLVPLGTVDYAPYLTSMQDADCAAYWFADTTFLQQYYDFGKSMPISSMMPWSDPWEVTVAAGDNAIGLFGSGHRDTIGPEHPDNGIPSTPEWESFVAGVQAKTGKNPDHFMGSAYITVQTFLAAAEATGGDTSPAKLIPAWRNVKVTTPLGVLSFDKDGVAIGDLYVFEFEKDAATGVYYWEMVKSYPQIPIRTPSE
jgi:branched-chain amino acid transport system substrate-binding protein